MSTPIDIRDVNAHLDSICKEAGFEVMRQVFDVIQNRENVPDRTLLALDSNDITELYDFVVGPAIDKIEDEMLA